MPDVDGKLLLDPDGKELLNPDGTEACECCGDCPCPAGLPSTLAITFTYNANHAVGPCDETHTFTITFSSGSCRYDALVTVCTVVTFQITLVYNVGGPAPCKWSLSFSDPFTGGEDTEIIGDDPTGAYPDTPGLSALGQFTNISIS